MSGPPPNQPANNPYYQPGYPSSGYPPVPPPQQVKMFATNSRGNFVSPAGPSLSTSTSASAASGLSRISGPGSGISRISQTSSQHQHHGICAWRSGGEGESSSPAAPDHSRGEGGKTPGKWEGWEGWEQINLYLAEVQCYHRESLLLADEDYLGWSGCWVSSDGSWCGHWRGSGWGPTSSSPPSPSWSSSPWPWSSLAPLILIYFVIFQGRNAELSILYCCLANLTVRFVCQSQYSLVSRRLGQTFI